MRLMLVFTFSVLAGVMPAFAGDFSEAKPPASQASQPPEASAVQQPSPDARSCYFGPITMRIDFDDMEALVLAAPTRREGWYALLALDEDPEAEEITFMVRAPDDGLGDGLVCSGADRLN